MVAPGADIGRVAQGVIDISCLSSDTPRSSHPVTDRPDRSDQDEKRSLWDIRVFEPREDGLFRLHRERISELGVPLARIREALSKNFALLEEASPDDGPVTDESPRVFCACRNRLAPKML